MPRLCGTWFCAPRAGQASFASARPAGPDWTPSRCAQSPSCGGHGAGLDRRPASECPRAELPALGAQSAALTVSRGRVRRARRARPTGRMRPLTEGRSERRPSSATGEESAVHLKSLTLRGFKSFASATTLRFEPGITCVVGPNGSGKSNVVDALAWVMGEQGAKSLRGGKMEDVIFAGTAGRPPLGRAEVTLTIDNTDGALPIDYAEVTITRLHVPQRAAASTRSTATTAGCSTSRSCCPTPASAGRCTSSSARASSTRAARRPGGPPGVHRGGRRRPQAPQAQGEGAAQARRDAGQPRPAWPT